MASARGGKPPGARRAGTRRVALPQPSFALERFTLDNGLRVVVAPQSGSGVVGVSVHYDVGFRSEPEGRTGFAHLFEHLMFQGSESLPKLEHFRVVQSSGGVFNGSTHLDYTDFYEVLPSAALERGLFLEADRMRAPAITAENLANQVDVVSEEIRLNVLNRPYGGFPWILLPPVLYNTFPNAHNGYGDFIDLQAATVEDCIDFFWTYYGPSNAVLTICGDVDSGMAKDLAFSHFSDVPSRPSPQRPSFDEPEPNGQRRSVHTDPIAPSPALALGWQLPDPVADLHSYLAYVVLGSVLSDGESSRLQAEVVAPGIATEAWAAPGMVGGALDARHPDAFVVGALYAASRSADDVLEATFRQLDSIAENGIEDDELRRAVIRFSSEMFRENDSVVGRTRTIGSLELLQGRAELINEIPALMATVSVDDVVAAAHRLGVDNSAVLLVEPEGGQRG